MADALHLDEQRCFEYAGAHKSAALRAFYRPC